MGLCLFIIFFFKFKVDIAVFFVCELFFTIGDDNLNCH